MVLSYLKSTLPLDVPAQPLLLSAEDKAYASRLHEIENALLCQAFGGQAPQPDSLQRMQRYLDGEISYAEAFQPIYPSVGRWAN